MLLVGGAAVGNALERVRTMFPISAVAVLSWQGAWSELGAGGALLAGMAVPLGVVGVPGC